MASTGAIRYTISHFNILSRKKPTLTDSKKKKIIIITYPNQIHHQPPLSNVLCTSDGFFPVPANTYDKNVINVYLYIHLDKIAGVITVSSTRPNSCKVQNRIYLFVDTRRNPHTNNRYTTLIIHFYYMSCVFCGRYC